MEDQIQQKINDRLTKWSDKFFPAQEIYQQEYSFQKQLALFASLTVVFSMLGYFFPADGFIGFDWIHFFEQANLPAFYPPWAELIIAPLSWAILIGITLSSFTIAILKRAIHPVSAVAAYFTLPLFWTLFLGQVDGLLILGLLGLPWLTPLAIIKPQVTVFALLARRSYLVGLVLCLLLSFLLWGFWPLDMFSIWTIHEEGKYVNDISLGLWGLPISIILLWFSRGDQDMLMAAGVFSTPYLLPYNLLPLVPAIARLNPIAALIACLLSWLPFSANWINKGWYLGWIFILLLWFQLARKRYPNSKILLFIS